MSVLMMPDAGSHRCGYVSAGRTRPDDERIALVDGELGYASSSVPAGQAVCRAVLLVHRWEDDNSSWAPLIDGSLGSGARSSRSICPLTGCRTVTAACTPKNGTRSRGGGDCRATRPAGDRRGRSLRLQPRRSCRLRGRVRRAHPGRQADRRLGGRPPPAGPGERATRRGPHAAAGPLPGDARRPRGGRSRPRALRGVGGQDVDNGARVPGVDRRAAITAGADPAGLWRPRLLTAARRGGDVRTPAERPTRSAPRDELGTATPL